MASFSFNDAADALRSGNLQLFTSGTLSSEDLGKLLRQKDEDGRSLLHAAAAAAACAQALEMLLAQGTAAVNEVDDEVRV
jgi:hypothetical protein